MMAAMMRNLTLEGGRLSIWSTPFGKRGLFYRIWKNMNDEYPDYSRHKLNWRDCPRIDPKRIEQIERNMHPITYKQEYENDFISTGEELFPIKLIDARVRQNVLQQRAVGRNPYYIGIDFALGGGDNIGIVVAELMENKYVLRLVEKFGTKSVRKLISHILNLIERYNPSRIYCDATGMGNPLVTILQEEYHLASLVEGVVFTNPIKDKYIMKLWSLFNDGRIDIPNDEELKVQLNSLQTTETKSGLLSYDHIKGQHDDLVWACALSCYSEERRWTGVVDIGIPLGDEPDEVGEEIVSDISYS
jgi:phage FluMu gp28-like protein